MNHGVFSGFHPAVEAEGPDEGSLAVGLGKIAPWL